MLGLLLGIGLVYYHDHLRTTLEILHHLVDVEAYHNEAVDDKIVLDLFAGSGQLALEAVSRGARSALLVDSSRAAADIIRKNIEKTKFTSECRVLNTDYKAAIRTITGKEKFGIVFLDPPYGSDMLKDALDRILRAGIVLDNGYIVCESSSPEPVSAEGTTLKRFAKYGRKYVTLLVKNCEE